MALGKMECERCGKEVDRKTSNQKYCYLCNGEVSRELSKLRAAKKKKQREMKEGNQE